MLSTMILLPQAHHQALALQEVALLTQQNQRLEAIQTNLVTKQQSCVSGARLRRLSFRAWESYAVLTVEKVSRLGAECNLMLFAWLKPKLMRLQRAWREASQRLEAITAALPLWIQRVAERHIIHKAWLSWRCSTGSTGTNVRAAEVRQTGTQAPERQLLRRPSAKDVLSEVREMQQNSLGPQRGQQAAPNNSTASTDPLVPWAAV